MMKRRISLLCMMGCLWASTAHAQPPANVQVEVNFLLGYVEGSGACQFNRNGSWHDSKAAQEHLRTKYKYLAVRNKINTTEDFIEMAATKSSMSGKPYTVKCGTATVTSNQWLRDELMRFRKF